MLNKLQYLGEIKHNNMYLNNSLFLTDETLPFNQVYYKMIEIDNEDVFHQWFVSQNEELVEEGHVNTYHKYVGVNQALTEMLGEWENV
jgi:hypothetical protein